MLKRFGFHWYQAHSRQYRIQQIFQNLTQHRDTILGLAWLGYRKYGLGIIHFKEKSLQDKINYIPRSEVSDQAILRLIDQYDPTLGAVVLYDCGIQCNILTLTGSKHSVECCELLPDHLRNNV